MLSVPLVQPCSAPQKLRRTAQNCRNCAELRGQVWWCLHCFELRCGVSTTVNCPKHPWRVPTLAARSYGLNCYLHRLLSLRSVRAQCRTRQVAQETRSLALRCSQRCPTAAGSDDATDGGRLGGWLTIVRHLVRCSVLVASGQESRCVTLSVSSCWSVMLMMLVLMLPTRRWTTSEAG